MKEYNGAKGNYKMNLLLNDAQMKLSSIFREIQRQGGNDALFDRAIDLDKMLDFAINNTEYKEDVEMTDHKYEQVTDMTVGQVVDAILSGEDFYFYASGRYQGVQLDILHIEYVLEGNQLHRKIEAPWWENIKNNPLCWVWDEGSLGQTIRYIVKVRQDDIYKFVDYSGDVFQFARPITQEEKDAIITEG